MEKVNIEEILDEVIRKLEKLNSKADELKKERSDGKEELPVAPCP